MEIILYGAILLLLFYSSFIFVCHYFYHKRDADRPSRYAGGLTVVVCTHNEEVERLTDNLRNLADSLGEQDELIVVGDHRDDFERLRERLATLGERVIVLENASHKGKKYAQRYAVGRARNEVVICTDADCRLSSYFLEDIRAYIPEGERFMLLLPVVMRGDGGVFGRMVEMEFVCLQMVTEGMVKMGRPSMANGAGMVFTRGLYLEHDSHNEYASGDDMFLLQHAVGSGAEIRYIESASCLVETDAPRTLRAYLRQRVRWLSKSNGYDGQVLSTRPLALTVAAGNVSWLLGMVADWRVGVAMFVWKLIVDAGVYVGGSGRMRSSVGLWVTFPLEFLYPFMIFYVGIGAVQANRLRW